MNPTLPREPILRRHEPLAPLHHVRTARGVTAVLVGHIDQRRVFAAFAAVLLGEFYEMLSTNDFVVTVYPHRPRLLRPTEGTVSGNVKPKH